MLIDSTFEVEGVSGSQNVLVLEQYQVQLHYNCQQLLVRVSFSVFCFSFYLEFAFSWGNFFYYFALSIFLALPVSSFVFIICEAKENFLVDL